MISGQVTGYYTSLSPLPSCPSGIRPFALKKETKYNILTFNPSRMEKPFLSDPGYFIHLLEVRICFCTFVLVVFGTPCSLPFPIYKLLTSTLYFSSLWRSPLSNTRHVYFKHLPPPTPSNVFEINKTIGGGGLNRGFTVFQRLEMVYSRLHCG